MPNCVTHPLPARLVLLAAAAALALSLVFAMVVAEQRDVELDRGRAEVGALTQLTGGAPATAPVEQLGALPVSAR